MVSLKYCPILKINFLHDKQGRTQGGGIGKGLTPPLLEDLGEVYSVHCTVYTIPGCQHTRNIPDWVDNLFHPHYLSADDDI